MEIIRKRTFFFIIFLIAIYLCNSAVFAAELKPIKLSEPQLGSGKSLMVALNDRKSVRSFSEKELPLDVVSNLLWAAFGINRPGEGKHTAPSAGNRQEIDIYVAMKGGLYLYDAQKQTLVPVLAEDIREFTGKQDFTQRAPLNLIYVANFAKMGGEEADKVFYSATDTGFISQNVYLFCASENLATVVLGMVNKPALAKIMKLGKDQHIILTQPVGYPE
ncbi:MAG: SagB/ThcOx family dehydrogenase [Candidatus Omnitrophota bacterium]